MTPTTIIALALGIFFLLVALANRIRSIRERRHQADIRSAALNGGTPEAPVHLESPFTPRVPDAQPVAQVPPPVAAPMPSVPPPAAQPAAPMIQPAQTAPVAQAAPPPASPSAVPAAASKDDYQWE